MTRQEYGKITIILKSNYQRFPNYVKSLEDKTVLNAQYELLKDLSYDQASASVMSWCQKEKFPPTVADIRGECYENDKQNIGDDEAWGWFMKAIKAYNYNNAEELYQWLGEKDKVLEQVARNIRISEIAKSPVENAMADRAHFLKLYAAAVKRKKDHELLSPEVRKAIDGNIHKQIEG